MKSRKIDARHIIPVLIAILALLVMGAPAVRADGQNGTTLSADVTETAHLERTFHWTIDKSVTRDTLDMFKGDSGNVTYRIAVTKDDGTVASFIDGQVCVTNGGAVATENLKIVANVTMPPGSTVIESTFVDVSGHPVLAAGESHCYAYSVNIPEPVAGETYKVTADVTITNHSGHLGVPFGPDTSATTVMPASPTLINDSINVDDSNGGSWIFNTSGSATYGKTFTCNDDRGTHNNTATIRETGQSDSARVTVNCYELTVTKTAATSLTRTYNWTIDKSADQSALTLALNQPFVVNYTVKVDATSTDSNWAVSGDIYVDNPAPMAATLTGVTDVVSGGFAGNVTCPSLTVPAGGTLHCTYTVNLPNADSLTNTATATLQNTPSGTTDFSGTAGVDFSNADITLVHPIVDVEDTLGGNLGSVSGDAVPRTFYYSAPVGPYTTCGQYTVPNTATFTAQDIPSVTGSDSWTVNVNVPCAGGCTLTIGYWKTHAGTVGNNRDMVTPLLNYLWLGTAGGAKSVQVTTAAQAITLLSMSGDPSNGINKLYAQLLGAKLNIKAGASNSAVAGTISAADAFLATHNASDWASLSRTDKNLVLSWATALDNYNNGLTGPGHCSQ